MNILLVEDELRAARTLMRLLHEVRPEAHVLAHTEGVADTVAWLQEHPTPDLLLMDIHLADGSSFEVFRHVSITCPVIFITAYDEYALEAFQANGIDYLLKPLTRDSLLRGLRKFDALQRHYASTAPLPAEGLSNLTELLRTMQQLGGAAPYKTSWLIPHKARLIPVPASEVAHFVIQHGLVSLTTLAAQRYVIDNPLDELESQVDPRQFFRANRQVLFSRASVVALEPYHGNRMAVHLQPPAPEDVLVPKLRVTELRKWVSGG